MAPPRTAPNATRTAARLYATARIDIAEAHTARDIGNPAEQFRSAHLAALRVAAAVIAERAVAHRPGRATDAWTLLAAAAPEHADQAAYFAGHSAARSAVEAGVRGRVTQETADEVLTRAEQFLSEVTGTLPGTDTAPP